VQDEHLNVEKLMKRYAKLSIKVKSKVDHFSKQHLAQEVSLTYPCSFQEVFNPPFRVPTRSGKERSWCRPTKNNTFLED
jgi:hypothetical protein